jgi:hypothetical protein
MFALFILMTKAWNCNHPHQGKLLRTISKGKHVIVLTPNSGNNLAFRFLFSDLRQFFFNFTSLRLSESDTVSDFIKLSFKKACGSIQNSFLSLAIKVFSIIFFYEISFFSITTMLSKNAILVLYNK